jgi:hypothetical protein
VHLPLEDRSRLSETSDPDSAGTTARLRFDVPAPCSTRAPPVASFLGFVVCHPGRVPPIVVRLRDDDRSSDCCRTWRASVDEGAVSTTASSTPVSSASFLQHHHRLLLLLRQRRHAHDGVVESPSSTRASPQHPSIHPHQQQQRGGIVGSTYPTGGVPIPHHPPRLPTGGCCGAIGRPVGRPELRVSRRAFLVLSGPSLNGSRAVGVDTHDHPGRDFADSRQLGKR